MTEAAAAGAGAIQMPRIHSLDSYAMTVPDISQAERFYQSFGLPTERSGTRLHLRTFGNEHIWATINEGTSKRLSAVRFGIYSEDFDDFAERLQRAGHLRGDASDGVLALNGLDGLPIELVVAEKTSPDAKSPFDLGPRHDDVRGTGPRSSVATVKPLRLAHIALFTPDVQQSIEFYTDVLGLGLSDRSGNEVAFLHGRHGSDHHLIAIARSDGYGLHHCSWDVSTLQDVGRGAAQMADAGYAQGWGLGQHVLGSNYFHYVRDPWGSYCEYSADMDYVSKDIAWAAGDHPAEDSFYQWGPAPPEDFGVNYETSKSGAHSA